MALPRQGPRGAQTAKFPIQCNLVNVGTFITILLTMQSYYLFLTETPTGASSVNEMNNRSEDGQSSLLSPSTYLGKSSSSSSLSSSLPLPKYRPPVKRPRRESIEAELFMDRLDRLLPKGSEERVTVQEVEAIEKELLHFNIPTPIIVDFEDSAPYISIQVWRWINLIWPEFAGQTDVWNEDTKPCQIRHFTTNAGMTHELTLEEKQQRPSHIKIHEGCVAQLKKESFVDHENQVTVGGCGESQLGSGSGFGSTGRHDFDLDTSFWSQTAFPRTYAHLHLVPEAPHLKFDKNLRSVTDMVRQLLKEPPEKSPNAEDTTFIHNNCGGIRGNMANKLISSPPLSVARYGQCWHNKNTPNEIYRPDAKFYFDDNEASRDSTKTLLASLHPFTFSLENTLSQDYFTEKRWQALLGGSIPIVWENDNSLENLPEPSAAFIIKPNADKPKDVAQRLHEIAQSPEKQKEYFAWKHRDGGLRKDFVRRLFLSTDYVIPRMCEYVAHAYFYEA